MKKWLASAGLFLLPLLGLAAGWSWRSYQVSRPFAYSYAPIASHKVVARLEREIAFYQSRVHLNPDRGLDRAALAEAYLKMARATGNTQWYLLAERSAQESLAKLPVFNHSAILVQARVAEARHDFPEAIRLAKSVVTQVPEARSVLVSSYLALGRLADAEEEADRLVKTTPGLGSLMMRGLVRSARGKNKAAQEDFEVAIAREDVGESASSARVRTLLGRLHASQGNQSLATDLYKEALRISPRYPLAITYWAELCIRQGKYRQADRLYQSITHAPGAAHTFDHIATLGRAQLELARGNHQEAQKRLQEAAQLLRTHQDVSTFGHRRELAKILLLQSDPQGWQTALDLMEQEVSLRRDVETLDTFAWALFQQKKFNQAQEILQEALGTGVQDAGIYYRAGVVLQALNDPEQAQKYFDRAQQIDPTFNQQAQQLLGITL